MGMYIIYLISKTGSPRQYVGITSGPLQRRLTRHCGANSELGRAIRATGRAGFLIEILRETLSQDKASMLEQQYIRELGTLWPAGFNMNTGGSRSFRHIPAAIEKIVSAAARSWSDPVIRERRLKAMKMADRSKNSPNLKFVWADPERKEKVRESLRKAWAANREKRLADCARGWETRKARPEQK